METKSHQGHKYILGKYRAGVKLTPDDEQYCATNFDLYPEDIKRIWKELEDKIPDDFGVDDKNKFRKAKSYLKQNYVIKYNVVTGKLEITDNKGHDVSIDNIYLQINIDGILLNEGQLRTIIRAVAVEYDPFKDYFHSLRGKWDGQDYIGMVAACVKTKDQDFWEVMFRKALVRSIACAIDNVVNRIAIVLISRQQNTGKTMFIRYLSPWGDAKYYCEEKYNFGKQDSELLLTQNFVYNLDELQGMDPKAMNTIKSTLSKSVINARKAYRHDHEQLRRRCTFWGTSNIEEYLTDDTGNSRWLSFILDGAIDWQTYTKIPIRMVYAQAFHLWSNGFDYKLTREEEEKRDTENKNREQSSNELDFCSVLFAKSDNFMSNSEIIAHYTFYCRLPTSSQAIGKAMAQLGFQSSRITLGGSQVRGYFVDKLEPSYHNQSSFQSNGDLPMF